MAEVCDSTESWNSEPFVERKRVMDWLKEKYTTRQASGNPQSHKYRIYGIHGKKRVGKSCVVQHFLQQIQQDSSRNQKVLVESFDFDQVRNFQSFLNRLCNFYSVEMHKWRKESSNNNNDVEEEDFMDCMSQIEKKMKDNPSNKFIVFLDNMEWACGKARADGTAPDKVKEYLRDKIYNEFIHPLLPKCHNLLIFITSTETAKFAEFSRVACKTDLEEMTEEEAKCLLQNQVSEDITEKVNLSSIVRLCDGLPPTIIKAGTMLCDGEYSPEETTDLLRDFDNKMELHSDDLFPKDDRFDEQLRKFISRLSDQNKSNLRSLAEIISQQGPVSIDDAASKLNFDRNTAVFKLRFLLPLRFRGMVEVDRKTGNISMNEFFRQFVLSCDIKGSVGKGDSVKPPCGAFPKSGGGKSPQSTNPSDDGDDSDDQGPSANHLLLASHHSKDKFSRLLEEESAHGHHSKDKFSGLLEEESPHDKADNQSTTDDHVTVVPSHRTQDASSHLLEEVSLSEKPEPNVAKMDGQYFGNREEKPHYDITLTNQNSENFTNTLTGRNDLSPEKTASSNFSRKMSQPNVRNNPGGQSLPEDSMSNGSENKSELGNNGRHNSGEEKVTYTESSGEGMITNKQGPGEGRIANNQIKMEEKVNNGQGSGGENGMNEQKICSIKRSDTLEENTTLTCKIQTGKDMSMNTVSVEENCYQLSHISGEFPDNIPEKKTNRAGSLDDNSQQDHDLELSYLNKGKYYQDSSRVSVDTDKAPSSASNDTGNDSASETLVKLPYTNTNTSDSGHVTTLSQDRLSDTYMTGVSEHIPSQQFDAMSYFGSRDQDDPLASSFSSDGLFASGRYDFRAAIPNVSGGEWLQPQTLDNKDVQWPPQQQRLHVGQDNATPHLSQTGQTTHLSQTGQTPHLSQTGQTPHLSQTGQTTNLSQTGQTPHLSQTGQTPHLSQTGQTTHLFQTGQTTHLSQTGQTQLLSQTGQTQRVPHLSQTGQTPHLSQTGQTTHLSQTGQTPHLFQTGQTAHLSQTGQTQHLSPTGQTQYVPHLSPTGEQELSAVGRDLDIALPMETPTGLSVHNQIRSTPNGSTNTESHSQLTGHVEAVMEQEGNGMFASVVRVFRETFKIFTEMES